MTEPHESDRAGRRPRALFALIAIGLGVLVAAGIGEIAARLFVPDTAVFSRIDRWEAHPRLGRVLKPSQNYDAGGVEYAVNELRLRDRVYAAEPPTGVFRVAVVGDSFVFGVGAAESIFPKVLERRLGEQHPGAIEVMSIGMPGYGTAQQNDFLEEYLAAYRFDLVVLSFCVGNDVRENKRSLKWERRPEAIGRAVAERSFWDGLSESSRLIGATRGQRKGRKKAGERKYYEFVRDRMELAMPATYEDADWAAAWDRTLVEIDRMRAFAEDRGAEFEVFVLPDEYQLDEGLRAEIARRFGVAAGTLGVEPELVQRRLGAALSGRGIPVIDPLVTFREHRTADSPLYIPFDTHFDVEGNRLAAAAIEAAIVQRHGDRLPR